MEKYYPEHVAIILDGNRRWAKRKGLPQLKGHQKGFDNIKELAPYIIDKGVKYLSVFAFSTENFKRTEEEVKYLMDLFVDLFKNECDKIHNENIKIIFSGRRENLRPDVLEAMDYIVDKTKNNTKGVFNICLNYGGRDEITSAARVLASKAKAGMIDPKDITEEVFENHMMFAGLPPVDVMVRTSGEQRISNYLLWELAYAELIFIPEPWPDFKKEQFLSVLSEFTKRDRRFGGVNYEK